MSASREDQLLEWLRRRAGADLIGDDAALLPQDAGTGVTVDQQIAGTHFPPDLDPSVCGHRLLAVGLSDLAATGAQPSYAFLSLATPPDYPVQQLLAAVLAACNDYGLRLAGGDLARHRSLVASLTLLGRTPPRGRPLRRDGARPGDSLWLGSTVGESAAGRILVARGARVDGRGVTLPRILRGPRSLLTAARRAVRRHLRPVPQLELGDWLSRRRRAAAIDVSDGVGLDLHRLCRASGVGAEIDSASLPLAPRFTDLAREVDSSPLELALSGGEDYALLFALPARLKPPQELGCRRVGKITTGRRVTLVKDGRRKPLPPTGWDHFS